MKRLEQIATPDERQTFFTNSLDEIHDELRGITMNAGVPPRVHELFGTARILRSLLFNVRVSLMLTSTPNMPERIQLTVCTLGLNRV